jgi:glycosyl transferase family 87
MKHRAQLAIIVVAVLVLGWVAANGALWYRTADFYCLREGARLLATGQDPYDETLWRELVTTQFPDPLRGTATSSCVARYASPLWTAVVMLPFGVLPLELSASLWMALSIGAVIAGTRWIWLALGGSARLAPVFAAIVVTSQPFWLLLIGAQISGLLVGLLGAGVWLASRDRPALSGAALGALIVKPQVAGFFLPVYLGREALAGRWRAVAGAAAATTALVLISLALQPSWIPHWLEEVTGRRLGYAALLPTAWGLSADLFGTLVWAPLLIAIAVVAVAALVRGRVLERATFAAIALALALFAAPHVWSYDFLVLALPWGAALAIADRLPEPRRSVGVTLAVVAASLVPWSFYALALTRGQENLSAFVPVIAALAVALVVRLRSRSGP